jgi:hypothetical protein
MAEVKDTIQNTCHSQVFDVVNDKDNSGFEGIGIVSDIYGERYSITKTKYGVWSQLCNEYDRQAQEKKKEIFSISEAPQPKVISGVNDDNDDNVKYITQMEKKSSQAIVDILDSIQMYPPPQRSGISITQVIKANLTNLVYFCEIADLYGEELTKLELAGMLMRRRLFLLRSELHRQLTTITNLNDKLAQTEDNQSSINLGQHIERQGDLQLRTAKLLEKLAKARTLLLSDQEKKWFSELKRLRQKIYNSGGLEKRARNVSVRKSKMFCTLAKFSLFFPGINAG